MTMMLFFIVVLLGALIIAVMRVHDVLRDIADDGVNLNNDVQIIINKDEINEHHKDAIG